MCVKYFGTDGIRGVANIDLTPELALQVGRATALVLSKEQAKNSILIGRDPRISGPMLAGALIAGITSTGLDVIDVGVVPTPAVAFLTKTLGCSAGIMISASHNPVQDNGLKVFAADGYKLSEQTEAEIEALLMKDEQKRPIGPKIGRLYLQPDLVQLYIKELKEQVPLDLNGLHLVIDCANGATAFYAQQLFSELGAKVSAFYDQPNGLNINDSCGSTYPEKIKDLTRQMKGDLGFAFDGDGDRILAVDESGNLVDGDQILAIIGLHLLQENRLPTKSIIATAYSNGGLRQAFLDRGGDVLYAAPGDRFVLEQMRAKGCVLGGEQSGHILFLENSTTGDGLLTALKLLEIRQQQNEHLAALSQTMPIFPQSLVNIPLPSNTDWQANQQIKMAISQAEEKMGPSGRLFVRASGTEPLIRILGEHPNSEILDEAMKIVLNALTEETNKHHVS